MARYNHYFGSFLGGEVSPQTLGRSNTDLYNTAAQTIDNFIVQIQGGLERRPGTKYIADAKVTTETRLIPFFHSSGAEYALEFSNLKFRIFKDGAVVGGPTEVTTTYTTAQLPDLDFAQSGDTMYITHEAHAPVSITRASDTAWTLADVVFDCPPMFPVDDPEYGRTEDLGDTLTYVSSLSANTLGASATLVMNRTNFVSTDVGRYMRIKNFTADPDSESNASTTTTQTTSDVKTSDGVTASQYSTTVDGHSRATATIPDVYVKLPLVTTATRTTPYSTIVSTVTRTYTGASDSSAASGSSDIKAGFTPISNSTLTSTYSGSVITNEVATVTGNETESWGLVKITGYTSNTTVTVEIIRPLSSTSFHTSQHWQMSRFGSAIGYPKHVVFHEGRCYFGNVGSRTNILMGSKSGSITDFEPGEGDEGTITAASGLDFILSDVRAIQWLSTAQKLLVGDTGGVFSLAGADNGGINPLTPPIFRKIAGVECSTVRPLFMQGTTFFTYSDSQKVGSLKYQRGEFSGFDFADVSKFSSHLGVGGIKNMYSSGDVIWLNDDLGNLRSITFNEADNTLSWATHTMNGTVESLTSLNNTMYFAIKRDLSGTVQYIETLNPSSITANKEDAVHVDSSLTYSGSAATVITGLAHLEGEVVEILADGASHPDLTVASGSITLNLAASEVHVGIGYVSTVTTTEVVGGNRRGSSEGRTSRIHEVSMKLLNTNGATTSTSGSSDAEIPFNENQVYGQGPDLFTGTKVETINSGNTLNPTVTVKSSRALPIHILGIGADINISET